VNKSNYHYCLSVCTICGAVFNLRRPFDVRCTNTEDCLADYYKLKPLGEFVRTMLKSGGVRLDLNRHSSYIRYEG
jgi:hypothetical protein